MRQRAPRARSVAHHLEHARQRGAAGERAQAGALDHRAVGERIGERHAELDDVGAALRRLDHQARASSSSEGSPAMK